MATKITKEAKAAAAAEKAAAKKLAADKVKAEKAAAKEAKKIADAAAKASGSGEKKPTGKGDYSLTLRMNGEVFSIKTDDLKTALLSLRPKILKTKVIVEAAYGDAKNDFVLPVMKARRIFISPVAAEIFAKNIKLSLNGK